jgi:thiol-disulfide isomerase/thioredoxin
MKKVLILAILFATSAASAQVEISGLAKKLNDSLFYIQQTGGFHPVTGVWRDTRVKFLVDKQGRFKATVPEDDIGAWSIKLESGYHQQFHLVKGSKLSLVADFSKEYPLVAVGEGAADFNYYSYAEKPVNDYREKHHLLEKEKSKNLDSVLNARIALRNFQQKLADEYHLKNGMSADYYKWISSEYKYEPFELTLMTNVDRDAVDQSVVSKIMTNGIDDDYAAKHTSAYNYLVQFYTGIQLNNITKSELTLSDKFDLVSGGKIINGSTKDVFLTRLLVSAVMNPDSIYTPLFDKYERIVQDKEMKQFIIDRRNEYANRTVSSKNADGSVVTSVSEIISKYKGKIVYVDFWASWCLPCRGEMPGAAVLKQNLKNTDIVFLYLAYNDREKAWFRAREQMLIAGEHYLLDEKMSKEAAELFGIKAYLTTPLSTGMESLLIKRQNAPVKSMLTCLVT